MLLAPFGSKLHSYLNIRTGFGAQPASYSTGTWGLFLWVTWPGPEAEHSPYSNAPRMPSWHSLLYQVYLPPSVDSPECVTLPCCKLTDTLYCCRQNKDKGQVQSGLQRPSAVGIGKGVPLQSVHHNQKEGRAGNKFGALWEAGQSVNHH